MVDAGLTSHRRKSIRASTDIIRYYAERAREYERIYERPERFDDLRRLEHHVRALTAGHSVREFACGTGYWTRVLAEEAESVLATDISPEVLEIAQGKRLPTDRVEFAQADAFDPIPLPGRFTAGFAGFWWSHLPRERIAEALDSIHSSLSPGASMMFIDNVYVHGESTPISRTDGNGNTYQKRQLSDGSEYEILKNFPDEPEFHRLLNSHATDIQFKRYTYYWCLWYRLL